ncbi:MAG: ArsB/NhaD family transporter [Candidatus Bathyarchaeia archaeon]
MALISPPVLALLIFILSYFFFATGWRERTIAAMSGALTILATGIISANEALNYVDLNSLGILFGMMVVVGVLKEAGFFNWLGIHIANLVRCNPVYMLILFMIVTGVLSAFLPNVTTVLFMTAIIMDIAEVLEVYPMPYIVAAIIASNIGGSATLVGDIPNIMIASAADIGFTAFIANLGPAAFLSLIISIIIIYAYFREMLPKDIEYLKVPISPGEAVNDPRLFRMGGLIFLATILLFFIHDHIGLTPASIALGSAILLLFIGGPKMPTILERIEWSTLIFFSCLYVIIGSLEKTGVVQALTSIIAPLTQVWPPILATVILWISAIASAFIDNVPFTAAFIPIIQGLDTPGNNLLWWALALGTGFGGNGTIIGSSASIVAIGIASKRGIEISFKDFMKIGMLTLAITTSLGNLFLFLKYYLT